MMGAGMKFSRPRLFSAPLASLTLLTGALLAAAPPAAADAILPIPKIVIGAAGKIANDYSALLPVRLRCDDFGTIDSFTLTVTQGDVVSHTTSIPAISCDGSNTLLTMRIGTGGPSFEPGPAVVSASMTVSYPQIDGNPSRTGTADRTVPMRTPAFVRIDRVVMTPDGNIAVEYALKCLSPWVPQVGSVFVSQKDGFQAGSRLTLPVPDCNGVWQGRRVKVRPGEGTWDPGTTVISVGFTVVDPDTGDPVGGAERRVVRDVQPR